ncbi:hypothetical protein ACFR9U_17240 [Halorientalis brevis]|uniref:Uncharacterized protein n=1 Tax=Halorientalis brevis TaxID=1126241 RepID=A0ABD6CFB4_9EURY|nr:hypothetical protein [Halorientalis brevis]
MTDNSDELEDFDSMSFDDALDALDKAIVKMSRRIWNGEFDEETEQRRIDRLNALANAVDARRRASEETPDVTLAELLSEEQDSANE